MKKENQEGESQNKRETNFQDTKKDKTRTNKCKKGAQQRRKQTKLFLRWSKRKQKKKVFATQNKNFVKKVLVEKTKRQQKTKKK